MVTGVSLEIVVLANLLFGERVTPPTKSVSETLIQLVVSETDS